MINICLDIGNTLSKVAVFENDTQKDFVVLSDCNATDLFQIIDKYSVTNAIISSVGTSIANIADQLRMRIQVIELSHETPIPIKNCYQSPQTLGKDRLAAVIGANYLHPATNLLVIDSGTAITYDIVNDNDEYLGGNISPGLSTRFKALNQFTARLPLVEAIDSIPNYGVNTESAILAGVQRGMYFEVDGAIDFYRSQYPQLKVLFTGGDSKYFVHKLKNVIFVVPNLVMIGLNRILIYNVKIS